MTIRSSPISWFIYQRRLFRCQHGNVKLRNVILLMFPLDFPRNHFFAISLSQPLSVNDAWGRNKSKANYVKRAADKCLLDWVLSGSDWASACGIIVHTQGGNGMSCWAWNILLPSFPVHGVDQWCFISLLTHIWDWTAISYFPLCPCMGWIHEALFPTIPIQGVCLWYSTPLPCMEWAHDVLFCIAFRIVQDCIVRCYE